MLSVGFMEQNKNKMLLSDGMKNTENMDIIVPEADGFSPTSIFCLVNLPLLFLEGSFNQDILMISTSWLI